MGEAFGWVAGDFVVDEIDKVSLMRGLDASDD